MLLRTTKDGKFNNSANFVFCLMLSHSDVYINVCSGLGRQVITVVFC